MFRGILCGLLLCLPALAWADEPKPVDTKPVDTKPVDTKPVDTKPVDTKPVDTKLSGDKRPVIKVSSVEEFISAVGPDRIVELAPGGYLLTSATERTHKYLRWDAEFDGKTLTIRNVGNLAIRGAGEKPVRLIVRPRYVFVLNFVDCHGVELSNLYLGHEPDKGECSSGVVGATNTRELTLRKCDLFGCGTEGLTLKGVRDFRFEESVLRDCSNGIMTANDCGGLTFVKSRFTGNREYWGFQFENAGEVRFEDCTIEKNVVEESLFKLLGETQLRMKGGAIRGNRMTALFDRAEAAKLEDTSVESGQISKPVQPQP